MEFIGPVPSLMHLSCVSISKQVWTKREVELKQLFDGEWYYYEMFGDRLDVFQGQVGLRMSDLLHSVKLDGQSLPLPGQLLKRVNECVHAFGAHIFSEFSIFGSFGPTVVPFLKIAELPLNTYGVVDRQALTRYLISSGEFSTEVQFHMAAMDCDFGLVYRILQGLPLSTAGYPTINVEEGTELIDYWSHFAIDNPRITPRVTHFNLLFGEMFRSRSLDSMLYFWGILRHLDRSIEFEAVDDDDRGPSIFRMFVCSDTTRWHLGTYNATFSQTECFITNALYFMVNFHDYGIETDNGDNLVLAHVWFPILCYPSLQREVVLAAFLQKSREPVAVANAMKDKFHILYEYVLRTQGNNPVLTYRLMSDCYYHTAISVLDDVIGN